MNSAEWLSWLRRWLTQHPLQTPSDSLQAVYTEGVMQRIRAMEKPSFASPWFRLPRVAVALGTVAACGLAVMVLMPRDGTQRAQQRSIVMLAESLREANETAWIEAMMEELEALEEDVEIFSSTPDEPITDEELLEELELFDDTDLDLAES